MTHHVDGVDWAGVNRPARGARGGRRQGPQRGQDAARARRGRAAAGRRGRAHRRGRAGRTATAGVPAVFTEIAADTRRTFVVVDTARGDIASFYEPGPPVTDGRVRPVPGRPTADALPGCAAVVLSGSLPPGLPAGYLRGADPVAAAAPECPRCWTPPARPCCAAPRPGPRSSSPTWRSSPRPPAARCAGPADRTGRARRTAQASRAAGSSRTRLPNRTGPPCWRRPGGCGSAGPSPLSSRSAPTGCSR